MSLLAGRDRLPQDGGMPIPDAWLSPHFRLSEMVRSQTATRLGIQNIPGPAEIRNLAALCNRVLEPIREVLGGPLYISSGYRSPELNDRIGGAQASQHINGQAADFTSWTSNEEIVRGLAASDVPYDQLILEFGDAGWVHVSWREHPRHEILRAYHDERGNVRYTPWV